VSRRAVVLFVAMSVIWGVPYLLIKVSVGEVGAAGLVFWRTAIGAAVLLPFAVRRGALGPALRRPGVLLAYAAVEVMAPWWLISDAELRVSSSFAGLVIAAVPLVGVLIARVVQGERVGGVRATGLLVGLGGVGALLGLDLAGGTDVRAVVQLLVTAVCYAAGPVIVTRYLGGVPALGVNALALSATAVVYLPAARLDRPATVPGPAALASVLTLGVLCTALALVFFFALIAEIGPARAVVITYVNPAVAVGLGVALLGEPLTTGILVGFPLVLAGSVLATWQRPAAVTAPPAEPVATRAAPRARPGVSARGRRRPRGGRTGT
jgi:drug/metabolite transporter (DMT)-like permease